MISSPSIAPEKVQTLVHAALRAWRTVGGTADNLLESLLIGQQERAAIGGEQNPAALRRATNQVLLAAIHELGQQDETAARLLRARFPDDNTIRMVANKFNISPDHVSRLQKAAIQQLAQIIFRQEMAARETRAHQMEAGLPPPSYDCLFGLEEARRSLLAQLLAPQSPWLINIVGIGGIGKTSLADALTRQAIGAMAFEHVIWLRVGAPALLSGRHQPTLSLETLITLLAGRLWPEAALSDSPGQRMVRVRQALKSCPHLIIIDNLEAESDTAYLLEHLADLAGPSKFLLTSRIRPSGQAGALTFALDELDFDTTAALLRHHAQTIGVPDLAGGADGAIRAIYAITGGNPLAVKLVVSLAAVLPLSQILADLTRRQAGPVEKMYRHIYRAAWRILTPDARQLLQAMPLVAENGAQPEQLEAISRLTEARLWTAVSELVARSLLEVRGTIWERRYGIHRLTESFLSAEINDWPDEDEDENETNDNDTT